MGPHENETHENLKQSHVYAREVKMALLRYLRLLNGLPDPRGLLSSKVPSGLAEVNRHVQEAIQGERTVVTVPQLSSKLPFL